MESSELVTVDAFHLAELSDPEHCPSFMRHIGLEFPFAGKKYNYYTISNVYIISLKHRLILLLSISD